MSEVSTAEIQNEISSVQSQMDSTQKQNAIIREQIMRLEACKSLIVPEKEKYIVIYNRDIANYYQSQVEWLGKTREDFSAKYNEFNIDENDYNKAIDNVVDDLNLKITELENKLWEGEGIIGWCACRLNDLFTLIGNAFN